jgi:hypothetical protein
MLAAMFILAGIAIAHAGLSTEERKDGVRVDLCGVDGASFNPPSDGSCHDEDRSAALFISKMTATRQLNSFPNIRLICPEGYELLTRGAGSPACAKDLVEPIQSNIPDEKEVTHD